MMKTLTLALSLTALAVGHAWAEDRSPRFVLKPGVLICDTLDQLIETISKTDGKIAEGCGFTQKPLYAEMVPEAPFDAHGYTFPLVRFEFPYDDDGDTEIDRWWKQYGFWGKPQKAVEPAKFETEA